MAFVVTTFFFKVAIPLVRASLVLTRIRERTLGPGERRLITIGQDERQALAEIGRGLGLELRMAGFAALLTGARGAHQVAISYSKWGDGARVVDTEARVEVDSVGSIPAGLQLAMRGARGGRLIREAPETNLVHIADPTFDDRVVLAGPYGLCLAAMDHRTREIAVTTPRLTIGRGRVTVQVSGDPERAVSALDTALALAQRMSIETQGVPGRLAENAASDPLSGVRAQNLSCLASMYVTAPETREALERALQDPAPEVRLLGAIHRGIDGLSDLRAVVLGEDTPLSTKVAGTEHAMRLEVDGRYTRPLLEHLLEHGAECELARAVRLTRYAPAAPLLTELLAEADDVALIEIVRALGAAGDATCQSELLGLLDRRDPDLQREVVRALGHIANVGVVAALQRLTVGLRRDPAVKRAALDAIARIQTRAASADAGQLSLAGSSAEGAVGLTDDAGDLSLSPPTRNGG